MASKSEKSQMQLRTSCERIWSKDPESAKEESKEKVEESEEVKKKYPKKNQTKEPKKQG